MVASNGANPASAPTGVERVRTPLRVIVADDDPATRSGMARAVRELGHDCRTARDGQEAWELHEQQPADVFLCDWSMPRLSGEDLCRKVRAAEARGGYAYFVLVTGHGDKHHLLRGMQAGADDFQRKPVDLDELAARLLTAERVILHHRDLAEESSRLRRDSQRSFRAARIDPLTRVPNRLQMEEAVDELWARARRLGGKHSAALCDIDHFKQFNDQFGHLAGDEVLRSVAQGIRSALRQSDEVYRYGGEEFLVILPEQGLAEAARAMDRVRAAIANLAIAAALGAERITISVGVAELTPEDPSFSAWIERADQALYRAKHAGRNRVAVAARTPDSRPR